MDDLKNFYDASEIIPPPSKLADFVSQTSRIDNYHKSMHDTVVSIIDYLNTLSTLSKGAK